MPPPRLCHASFHSGDKSSFNRFKNFTAGLLSEIREVKRRGKVAFVARIFT